MTLLRQLVYLTSKGRRFEWLPQRGGGTLSNDNKLLEGGVPETLRVEHLKNRSLIAVRGSQAPDLLQSLLTNDIRILEEKNSLFGVFLNSKGKVIHEAIIYKSKGTYFIECDVSGIQALQMHMKMYKLGREAFIESTEDEMKIWVVFDPSVDPLKNPVPASKPIWLPGEDFICAPDPRLAHLGVRVLAPKDLDLPAILRSSGLRLFKTHSSIYKTLRYKLGVGEGLDEIPYSKYTAMEANADFLNGICQDKPIYIGQKINEAKLVKKRLMPLVFDKELLAEGYPVDSAIVDVMGRQVTPLGQLRGLQGCFGLGLVTLSAKAATIKLGSVLGRTFTPYWWPQQLHQHKKRGRSETSRSDLPTTIHL